MKNKRVYSTLFIVLLIILSIYFMQGTFLPTTVFFSSSNKEKSICVAIKLLNQVDKKCIKNKNNVLLTIQKNTEAPLFLIISENNKLVYNHSIEYIASDYPMHCIVDYFSNDNLIKKCERANIVNTYFN